MAKATKGSAGPRTAAGDLSTRDQTTAISRTSAQEPSATTAPPTVLRAPNGRFVSAGRRPTPDTAATTPAAEPKVTVAANQTRPRKTTATSRTGSTGKSTT